MGGQYDVVKFCFKTLYIWIFLFRYMHRFVSHQLHIMYPSISIFESFFRMTCPPGALARRTLHNGAIIERVVEGSRETAYLCIAPNRSGSSQCLRCSLSNQTPDPADPSDFVAWSRRPQLSSPPQPLISPPASFSKL